MFSTFGIAIVVIILLAVGMLVLISYLAQSGDPNPYANSVPVSDETFNKEAAPGGPTTHELVLVVGDETAKMVAAKLAENGIRATQNLSDEAYAKMLVFAVDSTTGPMPEHRELCWKLTNRPADQFLILFTKTNSIFDDELLELEELECRELFNHNGLPGDRITAGYDAPRNGLGRGLVGGWDDIVSLIRSVVSKS